NEYCIAIPTHERMRHNSRIKVTLFKNVVENQIFFLIHFVPVVWFRNNHVAIQTKLLLIVFPDMRMVPKNASVRKLKFVGESSTNRYWILRDWYHAIHLPIATQSMRMQCCLHVYI